MSNPKKRPHWSDQLAAPFPADKIKWRQQKTERGTMYVAYIDARDCMNRLDSVLGSVNWQSRFEDGGSGRLTCSISISTPGGWISKSDGAGDKPSNKGMDAADANKADYSEAFKRACVQWRIGRYLYLIPKTPNKELPDWATPEGWEKIRQQNATKEEA